MKVKPQEFGIEPKKAQELTTGLTPHLQERKLLIQEFESIKDLELTEENTKIFRELRIKFQKNRTQGILPWHKKAKDIPLRMGQLIDAIKRNEESVNKTYEDKLEEGEKHFERLEAERVAKLKKERLDEITPYIDEEEDLSGIDIGEMSPSLWKMFLKGKKEEFEAKEEERRAELERIAEEERKDKVRNERKDKLIPYWNYLEVDLSTLPDLSEKEFKALLKEGVDKKAVDDAEKEKLRQKALEVQERNSEMKGLWEFTDVDSVDDLSADEFKKTVSEARALKKKAVEEQEKVNERNNVVSGIKDFVPNNYLEMTDADFKKAVETAKDKKAKQEEAERQERVTFRRVAALMEYWHLISKKSLSKEAVGKMTEKEFEETLNLGKAEKKRLDDVAKKEKAEKKAAESASDKNKILAFTKGLLSLDTPNVTEKESVKVLENVKKLLTKIDNYAKEQLNEG